MKRKIVNAGMLLMLVMVVFTSCQMAGERVIVLNNETTLLRTDEPIVITRVEMERQLGSVPGGMVPVLISELGDTVASQIDDLTGNGVWDELFFLYNLEPESQQSLTLIFVDPANAPVFEARTNIRMAEVITDGQFKEVTTARRLSPEEGTAANVYHHEGVAWENDLVGFRNYLDARNAHDIFGKTTTEMVLDQAGIGEDYHFIQDWGMDILMVGSSLGSGAIAVEIDNTVYRVAPEAEGYYEKVVEGPVRSIFRLVFNDWTINDQTYNLVHEISIHGGAWFFDNKVYFPGLEGDITLISGITTIELEDKQAVENHFEEQVTTVSTHGLQSYDGEYLGLAVMLDKKDYLGYDYIGDAPEGITHSFLVKMAVENDMPVNFRFYSGWEISDSRFADKDYFEQLLELDAQKMISPVQVSIQ